MPRTLVIGAVALLGIGGASVTPSIPSDMTLVVSYQYVDPNDVNIFGGVNQEGKTVKGTDPLQPHYVDDNGNGVISVAKFFGYKGDYVYVQLPDSKYADMGKINDSSKATGIYANPTKTELLSPADLLVPKAQAAIARQDNAENAPASGTSVTKAYATGAGANTIMVVGGLADGGSADVFSSATYAAVTMARPANTVLCTAHGGFCSYSLWVIAPLTGTNNLVINSSVSRAISSFVATYTGVAQTGQPDNSSGQTTALAQTSITATVTTIADNSWVFAFFVNSDTGNTSEGAGVNALNVHTGASPNYLQASADSNGPKTPAGAYTMTWSASSGTAEYSVSMISFSPFIALPPVHVNRVQINSGKTLMLQGKYLSN